MFQKLSFYHPITCDPKCLRSGLLETSPRDILKPYIRCFWTNKSSLSNINNFNIDKEVYVTPDTCMDIIFTCDYGSNSIECSFFGINDNTCLVPNNYDNKAIFGIRFFAWSAILFSNESLKDAGNNICDAENYFLGFVRIMKKYLQSEMDYFKRVSFAENLLISYLDNTKINNNLLNSIDFIIKNKGNVQIKDLCNNTYISPRQLQRIFKENIGISPKKISDLIRYQFIWNSIVNNRFNIMNLVSEYGFTDQAHLLNTFKKYHSMTPKQALIYANKDVAFLQEKK